MPGLKEVHLTSDHVSPEARVEKAEEQEPLRAKVKVVRVLELIQAVKELKSARCV